MDWLKRARCKNAPTKQFFQDAKNVILIRKLKKKYCSKCPVVAECLDYALKTDADGVWGNTTREERLHMLMWRSVLSVSSSAVSSLYNNTLGGIEHPYHAYAGSVDGEIHSQQALSTAPVKLQVTPVSWPRTGLLRSPESSSLGYSQNVLGEPQLGGHESSLKQLYQCQPRVLQASEVVLPPLVLQKPQSQTSSDEDQLLPSQSIPQDQIQLGELVFQHWA